MTITEKLGELLRKLRLNRIGTRTTGKTRAPKGHFAAYIGEERKRYVVPIECLSSVMFQALLNQYEEEIANGEDGKMILSCSTQIFEWILDLAKADNHIESTNIFVDDALKTILYVTF